MSRCLIRSLLLLGLVLPLSAGAESGAKAAWQQFSQCRIINCQAIDDSVLWIGTDDCGLIRFSPASGTMSYITSQNSDLPSNSVNSIAMAPGHVMWIGTDEGLAAFDGATWRIFSSGNAPFPSNSISSVALDSSGGVWVGFTNGGVLVYSSAGWTDLLDKRPGYPLTLTGNTVYAIVPVNSHDAWISWNPFYADNYGLAYLDDAGWHAYGYQGPRWLARDSDGAVWFTVYQRIGGVGGRYAYGLARLKHPDSLAAWFPSGVSSPGFMFPSTTSLTAVAIDGAGKKWAGAGNGVVCLNDTVWSMTPPIQDTVAGKGYITSIVFDKAGKVWAAFNRTEKDAMVAGLSEDTTWNNHTITGSGIPFNDVRFISQNKDGSVWVGGQNRLARYRSGKWQSMTVVDSSAYYYYFCADGKGGVWISKSSEFIHGDGASWGYISPPGPEKFFPECIYTDAKGVIWAGTSYMAEKGYCLVGYDTLGNIIEEKDSLPSFVNGIARTSDGTLWVAVAYNGFLRRAVNGSWSRVTAQNSNLPSDTVTGIVAGPDGSLWVGTGDKGLLRYVKGQWTTYDTVNSGIPGQNAKPLCIDSSGNVWLLAWPSLRKCRYNLWPGSSSLMYCYDADVQNGLVKFDGLHWTVYNTINSGLPSTLVYTAAAGDSGRIWVGTDKGLALFDTRIVSSLLPGPVSDKAGNSSGIRVTVRCGSVTFSSLPRNVISVDLFTVAGRQVCTALHQSTMKSSSSITISRLTPGFYIARIRAGSGKLSEIQKQFVVPMK